MDRLVSLAVALAVTGCAGKQEPQYQGRGVDAWAAQLRDSDPSARQDAVRALEVIGAPAVPALIAALKDPDGRTRGAAADGLGRIGAEARAAVPELLAALRDPEPAVRRQAALALGLVASKDAAVVPALADALKDSDLEVRRNAAFALGKLGAGARAAVPALNDAFTRADDPQLRVNIRDALERIGEAPSASN